MGFLPQVSRETCFLDGNLTRPLVRTSAQRVKSLLGDRTLLQKCLPRKGAGSQVSRTAPSTYLGQWPFL